MAWLCTLENEPLMCVAYVIIMNLMQSEEQLVAYLGLLFWGGGGGGYNFRKVVFARGGWSVPSEI